MEGKWHICMIYGFIPSANVLLPEDIFLYPRETHDAITGPRKEEGNHVNPPKTDLNPALQQLIDCLEGGQPLTEAQYVALIEGRTPALAAYLFARARAVKERVYGSDVYIRGLIEISSYCKNDCYYCGIRCSNEAAERYRLDEEQILSCCENGYGLGFRTFVLQGGEDGYYTDARLCALIRAIKARYPDCAITLSLGERSEDSYRALREAGADRYLLRHETADDAHYRRLHPPAMQPARRKACLHALKALGYQVGAGFMVGSPGQTAVQLAADLLFLRELQPHMVGIGPFIPHKQTPFAHQSGGTLEQTLFMLGLLRLTLPRALLPATTALGTIDPEGREQGILAGANVVMPNLSPVSVRKKYSLYDNKICTGDEAAECIACLTRRMESVGAKIVVARGDYRTAADKREDKSYV